MSNENDGIVASSTIGDGGTSQDTNQKEEQTVPYSRFKSLNDKYKSDKAVWEARFATLEARVNNGTATKAQEDEFAELEKLSPAQALKRMAEIAEEKAFNRLKSEQSKSQSETDKALQLMDDGFDHLREIGKKVSSSTEKELSKLAMDYKINIESPEDFEKVYDLYETIAKSKGTGKAEKAETLGTVTKKATPTTSAIDTRGSFSDIAQKSYAARFGS